MRVLWLSVTPSLYEERTSGGWVASLERIIRQYGKGIELGIAFEHKDKCFKVVRDGVTYYPMNKIDTRLKKFRLMLNYSNDWNFLKPLIKNVIDDFKPDIIHCFGSEWPFGLIARDINVPLVIHMQGFANIYALSASMCCRLSDQYKYHHYNPFSMFHYWYRSLKNDASNKREQEVMRCNKYFMGRTEWDKNIVKYYSPGATYYHCEEAIRPEILHSKIKWSYIPRKKMRIVTISGASALKGNDLILRTAKILKDFGFDFEWRVAGNRNSFRFFEKIIGLKHSDLNINLLGFINANEVANELSEADVYVHTAIIDNSPNSLCEAQLIGCPVIATNVGGIPQLVDNGKTGILFPYNEPHTLAFMLMNIYGNKKELESLSKNEINVSHSRHDEQLIMQRLIAIYTDIIKSF